MEATAVRTDALFLSTRHIHLACTCMYDSLQRNSIVPSPGAEQTGDKRQTMTSSNIVEGERLLRGFKVFSA